MNLRPFELFLILGFGLLGLLALGLLATYKPPSDTTKVALGTVDIWGTISEDTFYTAMKPVLETQPAYKSIIYTEKDPNTFDNEVLNALADNSGPVAVAALKTPFESYKIRVVSKAGGSARHQEFALELGYVYVEKTHRKQGLCEKVGQASIAR